MKPGKGVTIALGGLIGLLVVGGLGMTIVPRMLGHYFWPVEQLFRSAPEQPVPFPHPVHVQSYGEQAGIDCVFCHRTAPTEAMASIPSVEQCYFCHKIVGQESGTTPVLPGVKTLNEVSGWDPAMGQFGEQAQPINWIRVHRLPDHVRFVHSAHVQYFSEKDQVPASVTCATCHGKIEKMMKVEQVRELKMGDCVNCHKQNGAPTDCATCHY